MDKEIQERLEIYAMFYKDKARQPENKEKELLYEGYAAGINRAIAEIRKAEKQSEEKT
jgi:hypothetical protein